MELKNFLQAVVIISIISTSLSYNIEFYIRDINGNPIENATIIISSVQLPRDPVTDCNGFTSAELPQGTYNITIRKGNTVVSQTIYINSDRILIFNLNPEFYITIEPINGSVLVFRNYCYKSFTSNKHLISAFTNDIFEFYAVEKSLTIFEKWEYENKVEYSSYLKIVPNKNLYIKAYFKNIDIKLDEIIRQLANIQETLNKILNNQNDAREKLKEILAKLDYLIKEYEKINSKLDLINQSLSNIYSLLLQIKSKIASINNKLDKILDMFPELKNEILEVKSKISQLEEKITKKLEEIEKKLEEILNEIKYIKEELNKILNNQNDAREKLKEILAKLDYLINLYQYIKDILLNQSSEFSQKLLLISNNLEEISNKLGEIRGFFPELRDDIDKIKTKIDKLKEEIINKIEEIKHTIYSSKDEIIKALSSKIENLKLEIYNNYISKLIELEKAKEDYCIEILNDDYEKLYSGNFILLLKNCGEKNLTNVRITLKYLDTAIIRTIDLIYPHEIKYLIIQLPRKANSYDIYVYVSSINASTEKNVKVSFSQAKVYIEVPEIVFKEKEKEFFIKLINFGREEVTDFLRIEPSSHVIVDGEDKITIYPHQEKYVKIRVRLLEEKNFELKFSFAGNEIVKEFVFEKEKFDQIFIYLLLAILIAIILFLIFKTL